MVILNIGAMVTKNPETEGRLQTNWYEITRTQHRFF
jgi:hypothetical protein